MKRGFLFTIVVMMVVLAYAQTGEEETNVYTNAADNMLLKDNNLVVGGYGEVHYNQPLDPDVRNVGKLDVHRVVMLFGYNFSDKTQFITELEFEHVKEVYVEQAFLQHKLNRSVNLRGGLMLVPMEYHEPTTFNGVERPLIDKYIAPTTWREIGFGVTGNILAASLKYQAYIMNGFNGYDGSANLGGKNGLRKGRQKGAESYMSSPNFTGKVEYYGIRGLNVGLSGYFGKTQSTLYDGISESDDATLAVADSSVVGVSMIGLDARYTLQGFQLRGQFYYSGLSNTGQYNEFTASADGSLNDLGSSLTGYYVEGAYDVLRSHNTEKQLMPFVRYSFLNTHSDVESNISKNPGYEKNIITTGLTLKLTPGAVVKADMQFIKSGNEDEFSKTFNAGIGVMF
jgi:outer membrane protease